MPPSQSLPPSITTNVAQLISNEVDASYQRLTAALVVIGLIKPSANILDYYYLSDKLKSLTTENNPFPPEIATSPSFELSFKTLPNGKQSLMIKWSHTPTTLQDKRVAQVVQQITITPSSATSDHTAVYDWLQLSTDFAGNILEIIDERFDSQLNPSFNALTEQKWFSHHDPLLRAMVRYCQDAAKNVKSPNILDKFITMITEALSF